MSPLEWHESKDALHELHALGVKVVGRHAGSSLYRVVGGRSARRWWLLPAYPRAVGAASYGLFQPTLLSARILTRAAVVANELGLAKFTGRGTVCLTGRNLLADLFAAGRAEHFAYFSGTPGPHRKTVVQVMAGGGQIIGYAKVTCEAQVAPLLQHEADILERVGAAELRCARVPRVLYHGAYADSAVLLSDTVKTGCTRARSRLGRIDREFLDELPTRCPLPGNLNGSGAVLHGLRMRFNAVLAALTPHWRARLQEALAGIAGYADLIDARGLAHGDFTPWNSFPFAGELYVFDWEYADWDYPADYDLIHFLSATPAFLGASAQHYASRVIRVLTTQFSRSQTEARVRLIAYFCARTLRYACRESQESGRSIEWADSARSAIVLDTLLAAHTP